VGITPAGISGMGGIGKTQLAVEYAYRHRAAYPGGVFWVNAARVQDWAQELVALDGGLVSVALVPGTAAATSTVTLVAGDTTGNAYCLRYVEPGRDR
jgi:predicted ATPase